MKKGLIGMMFPRGLCDTLLPQEKFELDRFIKALQTFQLINEGWKPRVLCNPDMKEQLGLREWGNNLSANIAGYCVKCDEEIPTGVFVLYSEIEYFTFILPHNYFYFVKPIKNFSCAERAVLNKLADKYNILWKLKEG